MLKVCFQTTIIKWISHKMHRTEIFGFPVHTEVTLTLSCSLLSVVAQVVKNRPQSRRCGFNPEVRKTPWRRELLPIPVFLPGESHGQRSLAGSSPWGGKELDMTEQLSTHIRNTEAISHGLSVSTSFWPITCSKFSKPGLNSTWTMNFQMFKVDLEKAK